MKNVQIQALSSQEVQRLERRLQEQNDGESVLVVTTPFSLERAFYIGNKYLVAELANGMRQFRVGSDYGDHSKMILRDEGERLVGAQYLRYDSAQAVLELYGMSASFPMDDHSLDENRLHVEGVVAANPCGFVAAQSAIAMIMPTVTIRAKLGWS